MASVQGTFKSHGKRKLTVSLEASHLSWLCLTKFELKQTLNTEKYGKECVAWESQDFLFYHPTLWKDTFVPPFDYLVMITEVCGLKSNMISKLIKHRKKREPGQSTRKLTACLIQSLSAWNSLSQACLVMLSFWDTQLPSRRAWKKTTTTIRKIKYLKELEDKFLFEH